jgi:ubiquinone/menaquinone biosynthesis C-methylase UbiE
MCPGDRIIVVVPDAVKLVRNAFKYMEWTHEMINYATCIDPLLRDVRKYIPAFAGMQPGCSVLDVCCGSGAQVYEYLCCGVLAQGVDNNPDMLGLAGKYYSADGDLSSRLTLADATGLPFKDEEFDFTSITMALHDKESASIDRILAEMKRVTRKNGSIILADYNTPLPWNMAGTIIRAIEKLAGTEHHRCFKKFLQMDGLHDVARRNGIKIIRRAFMKSNNIMLILATAA